MRPDERRKDLDIVVSRQDIAKILSTGHAFDINKGGYYDARSGAVNMWCGPDDKPSCWNRDITKGALNHPREYVAGLYWNYLDDNNAKLFIDVIPFEFITDRRQVRKPRYGQPVVTEEEWASLLDWATKKTYELLRLASLHPTIVGTKCPYCNYVSPNDELLNALIEHIANTHQEVKITGVILGIPTQLSVMGQNGEERVVLEAAEDFS